MSVRAVQTSEGTILISGWLTGASNTAAFDLGVWLFMYAQISSLYILYYAHSGNVVALSSGMRDLCDVSLGRNGRVGSGRVPFATNVLPVRL